MEQPQKIDLDFWSSITRIDVDLEPEDYTPDDGTGSDDSNLPPNPHPAIIPDGNGNPRYEVPADNPFIGATSFNGLPVTPTSVRTEFWAVGLRNPWRISFDPPTGDSGAATSARASGRRSTSSSPAATTSRAFREGDHNGPKWSQRPDGWQGGLPPLYEYGHGSGEFQGNSITGGVVYRGNRIPSLYGSYIFADYVSGNIWALDPSTNPPAVQRIAGEGGLAGFGHDPSNGDILAADINSGMVRRLVVESEPGDFPQPRGHRTLRRPRHSPRRTRACFPTTSTCRSGRTTRSRAAGSAIPMPHRWPATPLMTTGRCRRA